MIARAAAIMLLINGLPSADYAGLAGDKHARWYNDAACILHRPIAAATRRIMSLAAIKL